MVYMYMYFADSNSLLHEILRVSGGLFDGISNLADLTIKKAGFYHLSATVTSVEGRNSHLLILKHNGVAMMHSKPVTSAGHEREFFLPTGKIEIILELQENDSLQLVLELAEDATACDVTFNGFLIG